MKSWAITILCCTTIAWTPAHADVQCDIVQAIGTLHDAQVRLRDYPDAMISESTLDTLRGARARLTIANIQNALGSNMSATDYAQVARFIDVNDQIINHVSQGQTYAARRFLNQSTNMQMSREVATILRTLPCKGKNTANVPQKSGDQIAGLRAFQGQAPPIWLVLAIVGAGAGILWYLRRRAGQRRRGRRYSANYLTQYECSYGTAAGTLLDISGSGAKLRHAPTMPVEAGMPITVEIEGVQVSANVMWNNLHYTGLRFEKPLSMTAVMQVHQFREERATVPA